MESTKTLKNLGLMAEEKLLNAVHSDPTRNGRRHHAQQQGAGDGDEELTTEQAKAKISGQTTKTEFLEPFLQAAENDQGQKHHDEPTQHNQPLCRLKAVRAVAPGKALG